MKQLRVVLSLLITLGFSAGFAQTKMIPSEHEAMLAAIEDYKFGDFNQAIVTLQQLHAAYPKHIDTIHYLSLSYEESKQFDKAETSYATWIALVQPHLATFSNRVAWLGYARVLEARQQQNMAAEILSQWVHAHPIDHAALIIYGDLLIRLRQFEQAKTIWEKLLSQPNIVPVHQAAAHYYLALGAISAGDMDLVHKEVKLSLQAQADGRYALPAQQLLTLKQQVGRKGFFGNASIAMFYSSNVDLLPDIVQLPDNKEKADTLSQLDLTLAYQADHYRVGYTANSSSHQNRSEFDQFIHSIFIDKPMGDWMISPRLEYVMLDQELLYKGGGFDLSWRQNAWVTRYQGRYRQFSQNFGALSSDLSRLGGLSHDLGVSHQLQWLNSTVMAGSYLHQESTKGDNTHNKTDDYTEFGINLSLDKSWSKLIDSRLFNKTYWRNYATADTNILLSGNENRHDIYTQWGGQISTRPFTNGKHRVVLQAHWQKNNSNYSAPIVASELSKEYTEWKTGLTWQYIW